jgi:hypothetical protein
MFQPQTQHMFSSVCHLIKINIILQKRVVVCFLLFSQQTAIVRETVKKNSTAVSSTSVSFFKDLFVIHSAYSEGVLSSNTH